MAWQHGGSMAINNGSIISGSMAASGKQAYLSLRAARSRCRASHLPHHAHALSNLLWVCYASAYARTPRCLPAPAFFFFFFFATLVSPLRLRIIA
jgi:hypothetical protein